MMVYILLQCSYMGDEIMGVYSTREKAEEARAEEVGDANWGSFSIEEATLDE